jgi:hypothetical protein
MAQLDFASFGMTAAPFLELALTIPAGFLLLKPWLEGLGGVEVLLQGAEHVGGGDALRLVDGCEVSGAFHWKPRVRHTEDALEDLFSRHSSAKESEASREWHLLHSWRREKAQGRNLWRAGIDKVPPVRNFTGYGFGLRCRRREIPTLPSLPCHDFEFDLVQSLHLSFPPTHHAAPATMTAREETVLPPIDPSITDENDWWEFNLTEVKVLRPGKMLYANLLDASEDNPVQVIGCLELKKNQERLGACSIPVTLIVRVYQTCCC